MAKGQGPRENRTEGQGGPIGPRPKDQRKMVQMLQIGPRAKGGLTRAKAKGQRTKGPKGQELNDKGTCANKPRS